MKPPALPPYVTDLDTRVLALGSGNWMTLDNLYRGNLALGSNGSGKSSGVIKNLARAALGNLGAGVLVLTAKDDTKDWIAWCREAGRLDDLIIFDDKHHRIDFVDYASRNGAEGSKESANLTELLFKVSQATQRFRKHSSAGEAFWPMKGREFVDAAISIHNCAFGRVTIADIARTLEHAPRREHDLKAADFARENYAAHVLAKCHDDPVNPLPADDLRVLGNYFGHHFRLMDERTRSGVEAEVMGVLQPFMKGTARRLFASGITTVTPELLDAGAVIVFALPIHRFEEVSVIGQVIFKTLFQRYALRRKITSRSRPLALFVDECQYFMDHESDSLFQSTCRSNRIMTCYATQNLPLLIEHMGGQHPEHAVKAWIGNLANKFLCSQNCGYTNRWVVEELIGRGLRYQHGRTEGTSEQLSHGYSRGYGYSHTDGMQSSHSASGNSGRSRTTSRGQNASTTTTEVYEQMIQTGELASMLRTGGPATRWKVDALLHTDGRTFPHTGRSWTLCTFSQR
ncbi:MAG: hypothetical protein KDJ34_16620 [Candidatus Competibacteraceae bacterium]|nr:hypothetical protein [Candidatus Competibacteraceae bacterium]